MLQSLPFEVITGGKVKCLERKSVQRCNQEHRRWAPQHRSESGPSVYYVISFVGLLAPGGHLN